MNKPVLHSELHWSDHDHSTPVVNEYVNLFFFLAKGSEFFPELLAEVLVVNEAQLLCPSTLIIQHAADHTSEMLVSQPSIKADPGSLCCPLSSLLISCFFISAV